jgi:hypothetical protein
LTISAISKVSLVIRAMNAPGLDVVKKLFFDMGR